jgi:D-arabinose 1-dehydrogenase-like Zn-dependent alcohol dehydrogenase
VALTRGDFPFPPMTPLVIGHEPAGEVVEVGLGVTSRMRGDRVGTTWVQATCGRCAYCARGLPLSGQSAMNCAAPTLLGMTVPGGHAEYLTVPSSSTVLLPEGMTYEMAAPMLCAGYSAWSALCAGEPRPHERVAVLGIGGLGHLALQFSQASGHETIAITRSPDKHDLAKKLGVDLVVSNGEELRDAGGADVILVTSKSYPAAADALRGLRVNGRIVLAGIDPNGSFTIGPDNIFWANRQQVIGAGHDGSRYLAEALDFVANGAVTPMIEVFRMEQVAEAVERVAAGDVRFSAVVTYG